MYDDDTIGELYMRMLEDSSPHGGDYPGAAEEYMRRLRQAYRHQVDTRDENDRAERRNDHE